MIKNSTHESKNINQTVAIIKFLTLENLPDSKVTQGQCLTHNVGHRLQGLV